MYKVLVTGGSGLVGNGIQNICKQSEYSNISFTFMSSKDCDLTDYRSTVSYFTLKNPDRVIHLAANVGGLFKNMACKVEMFETNMLINTNVLKACHACNITNAICCLSTCIFPDKTSYPINENMLHNGEPHQSNYPYAYAKRMLEVLCRSYNEQYGYNYTCIIPTNIYGSHDNYNLKDSHVIPGLIHKCYNAKKNNEPFVVAGTGKPMRQFIYNNDLAELILWTLFNYKDSQPIILSVSPADEVSIKDIANMIASEFDYEDNITFDTSYSDGQYKKTADNSKLMELRPETKFTDIKTGIKLSVQWFVNNYETARK